MVLLLAGCQSVLGTGRPWQHTVELDTTQISVNFENIDLEEALKQIMKQAQRQILYNPDQVKDRQVSCSLQRKPLHVVLNELLAKFDLAYQEMSGGQIVVVKREPVIWSISGYVLDASTGQPLPFANVQIDSTTLGTASDLNGYFKLNNLPEETEALMVRYIGYSQLRIAVSPEAACSVLSIKLKREILKGEEVQVIAWRALLSTHTQEQSTEMTLSPARINNISTLGEFNVIQAIAWIPGVSGVNDGFSGLSVRGGTDNQNLILYEGIQIYKTDHLFGLVSGINSDAVHGIQFYRGGFPAQYGGRTSSILLLNGNGFESQPNQVSGGINVLSLNASADLNLSDKVSLSFSVRRSYIDQVNTGVYDKLFNYISQLDEDVTTPGGGRLIAGEKADLYSFYYDVNAKLSIRATSSDRVAFTVVRGHDFLDQSTEMQEGDRQGQMYVTRSYTDVAQWGNTGSSVGWRHQFSEKSSLSLTAALSRYTSQSEDGFSHQQGETLLKDIENVIDEASLKIDNTFAWKENLQFAWGAHATENKLTYHHVVNDTLRSFDDIDRATSWVGYGQTVMKPWTSLTLTTGLRATWYSPTKVFFTEPRFSMALQLASQVKITGAYSHHY